MVTSTTTTGGSSSTLKSHLMWKLSYLYGHYKQERHHNQQDQEVQGKAESTWRHATLWSQLLWDLCPGLDMFFNQIIDCKWDHLWLGSMLSGFHHCLSSCSHWVWRVHGATSEGIQVSEGDLKNYVQKLLKNIYGQKQVDPVWNVLQ
jgi:hypothetical protein